MPLFRASSHLTGDHDGRGRHRIGVRWRSEARDVAEALPEPSGWCPAMAAPVAPPASARAPFPRAEAEDPSKSKPTGLRPIILFIRSSVHLVYPAVATER